jgi:cobalt transporter subunit CbtB
MQTNSSQTLPTIVPARMAAALPAVLAILFGVFLVFGAGFSESSALHNAAHDSRHALVFPCH